MTTAKKWPNRDELARTGAWIAAQQRPNGAIPWVVGGKLDAWDHVHSAMALAVVGLGDQTRAAFRYLAKTQGEDGSWVAARNASEVLDSGRESNHAAYLAAGLWHLYRAERDVDFLAEMWPTLERAIGFVLSLQDDETGVIWWSKNEQGKLWLAPLIAGCSSIHGSLVCAERVAQRLGHPRPEWERVRVRLAQAIRDDHELFTTAPEPLVEPVGRYSMDWYYPVLGGVLRGDAARQRLTSGRGVFLGEGAGCRCVRDRPWYTVAETCELVLALHVAGLSGHARDLYTWAQVLREEDGGYWMGIAYPEELLWPPMRTTWTAATVILAADALEGNSPTSRFFFELEGNPKP